MRPAASGCILTWFRVNEPMERQPSTANDRARVLVRPSRDSDVEAMLAIYRHHIRRGVEESVDDSGTPEPDDLRDRRKNLRSHRLPHLVATLWRRGRGLRLCRAVPQATGLPLRGQAFDLRPSRASRPRRRPACCLQRTDRCLRRGRLPPDDRLYRCRQHGVAGAARKIRLCPRRPACPASPIATAAGPTPSWCSARLRQAPPHRRRRCRSLVDDVQRKDNR